MVLNAAVQMLREAEELKQNILKFKSETSMLQERSLWSLQQQLQKIYQKVLVLDLDYALDKKVEQDLWNVGFKQQIEALQAISKDRKNPLRSEGQAMLSWVLQAAGGFYLCLLHQICTTFKLDLPFRRRASLLGWVEGWSPGASGGVRLPPPAAARYICQHCLVHLGDLARYRQQPRVAYTFYRHALVVSPHSGQPYNQLALLARRRGRRLGALYWHVRAILVRAPFPPATANLARTLQALAGTVTRDPPVLRGVRKSVPMVVPAPQRLDAHSYVTELIRALHELHTGDRLDYAEQLVEMLNASLTSLVAADCFESMTLIKMICVIIWLVHSTTEELTVAEESLSASEAAAASLSESLAAGAMLSLLLPTTQRPLPALKVCLQWAVLYPQLWDSPPFQSRPQLWHALAHRLNKLESVEDSCDSVPLPEDEELHGFQPLEQSFEDLKFSNHATWDTYGRRIPDIEDEKPLDQDIPPPSVVSPACLTTDPELEEKVRAHRLIKLGMRLAELRPDHFTYTTVDNQTTFTALCHGGDQLTLSVAALEAACPPQGFDDELDSEEDTPLPAPIVISEADFREKVRDKRAGILKPQGSLERAREERALATEDYEECGEGSREDQHKKEQRRPRVNIAMAAILRKQEETYKQVKFKTPPPVAEESEVEGAVETSSAPDPNVERPKTIQTKPQKSLSQIPVGRKTGGILALKDKSGYPHLVNLPPEQTIKKEESPSPQKDPKVIQPPIQKQQREANKWHQPQQTFDQAHGNQRNYGLHNVGISYNPNYQTPATVQAANANIRLPVVNPKEIDVRSAALQKQNARAEYSHRSPGYAMSSDKKHFLNDLPPRFANQRWNQESEENKFRDDEYRISAINTNIHANLFNTPPPNWLATMPPPPLAPLSSLQSPLNTQLSMATQLGMNPQLSTQRTPQMPGQMPLASSQITQYPPPLNEQYLPQWWKANAAFNPPTSTALTGQYYNPQMPQMSGVTPSYSQMTQIPGKVEPGTPHNYMRQPAMGQLPARHMSPPSFNTLGFGYQNIFDQFNKPPQYQSRGFLEEAYPTPSLELGRHIGLDLSPTGMDPYEPSYERRLTEGALERAMEDTMESTPSPLDLSKPSEQPVGRESPAEDPGTYSLFSGAPGAVSWGNVTQQQDADFDLPNWPPFAHHPPLPVERAEGAAQPSSRLRGSARTKTVRPRHPYDRPF